MDCDRAANASCAVGAPRLHAWEDFLDEGGVENFGGVEGAAGGGVFDLVTATGAGGGDECIRGSSTHGGEEDEFADLLGDFKMFGFVAKGAGHAAAAGGDDFDLVVGGELEGFDGGRERGERFLVAVAVELDRARGGGEGGGRDVAAVGFAGDEFFEEENAFREGASGGAEIGGDEVGEFVAEAEDRGRFDANEGGVVGDDGREKFDVAGGEAAGVAKEAFGELGAGAVDVIGDDDFVAEAFEKLDRGDADGSVVEIGEFVGEEVDAAGVLAGGW